MLATIPPAAIAGLRQLATKMEKIILVALDQYGNNFVEPKVELGARFGHLVCKWRLCPTLRYQLMTIFSAIPGYLSSHTGAERRFDESEAIG